MLEAVSMASNSSWRSNLWLLISLLIIFACNFSLADALTQSLCSSQNTGADSQPVSDDYQSNGKCFDTCKANYAFAVVQAKNCWCSNYIPADTTSVGSCNVPCPGYPFEKCGSSGFFGYVPLNKAPSGTLGASQSQSPTSIMTITGQVKTVTITPTAPPSAAADSRSGGFMSHPGKVAGLFVGVGLIICALAGALIWFYLRWKRNAETETIASTGGGGTPQRRQSKLSTMGLLGGTRKSNMRKSVPPIQTGGWGPGNSHEKSPSDTPIDYRRTSYPRVVDQRLDPMALWNPLQDNGSHVSIQSFRDDQDYSRRMLRVANPDDRPHSRE
ncbi:MAG: hypothetical protein LQ350_005831 [Teloschistes chrysophthalmus]|nr:MAG: hypothetical protein LQ350_005831 [Niorma chrysophthalma]